MRLKRLAEAPEIPTASMADIAFLLLIFFLVTSAFTATHGLTFTLPEQEEKSVEGDPAVNIRVKAEGRGAWSLVVDRRAMELAEVVPYVARKLAERPDKPVLLYADPEAPYGGMIAVYDELLRFPELTGRKMANLYVPTTRDVEEYTRLFGFNPFVAEVP